MPKITIVKVTGADRQVFQSPGKAAPDDARLKAALERMRRNLEASESYSSDCEVNGSRYIVSRMGLSANQSRVRGIFKFTLYIRGCKVTLITRDDKTFYVSKIEFCEANQVLRASFIQNHVNNCRAAQVQLGNPAPELNQLLLTAAELAEIFGSSVEALGLNPADHYMSNMLLMHVLRTSTLRSIQQLLDYVDNTLLPHLLTQALNVPRRPSPHRPRTTASHAAALNRLAGSNLTELQARRNQALLNCTLNQSSAGVAGVHPKVVHGVVLKGTTGYTKGEIETLVNEKYDRGVSGAFTGRLQITADFHGKIVAHELANNADLAPAVDSSGKRRNVGIKRKLEGVVDKYGSHACRGLPAEELKAQMLSPKAARRRDDLSRLANQVGVVALEPVVVNLVHSLEAVALGLPAPVQRLALPAAPAAPAVVVEEVAEMSEEDSE